MIENFYAVVYEDELNLHTEWFKAKEAAENLAVSVNACISVYTRVGLSTTRYALMASVCPNGTWTIYKRGE